MTVGCRRRHREAGLSLMAVPVKCPVQEALEFTHAFKPLLDYSVLEIASRSSLK